MYGKLILGGAAVGDEFTREPVPTDSASIALAQGPHYNLIRTPQVAAGAVPDTGNVQAVA